ncbi:MAG: PAS domain-containing protein [Proteobacteria bacterium]|nr:PAS domain-containing protein [Pseudomonadota bacterium]
MSRGTAPLRADAPATVGADLVSMARPYHDDIMAFHALWQKKCRGRDMPARADFDPAEMRGFLPGITIIDVVADARRFVYRLLGTREVAMRNNDPTGKGVAEGYYASSLEAAMAAYEDVMTRRAPRFEQRRFLTPDNRIGHEQTVILPLSDDGRAINKMIAYTHHHLI